MQVPTSENVIVMEKEYKAKQPHSKRITCLTKINDETFITCSEDNSYKIWDKDMQGCRYTIETHEPLHTMAITGEKQNLLISGLGEMDFMVLGTDQMNQNHISDPPAHDGKIIEIITLSKFQNKYFATRCEYGDFGIWGANKHPDRVLKILNMDDPEFPQDEEKPESKAKKPKKDDDEEEEEEELDDEGNPISKQVEEVVEVKKDFSNRISSERDSMIEIKWTETVIQSSATVLAVSNYNQSFVYITNIDLKMRRQNQLKKFEISRKPTKMYQINDSNLLVGTEEGKIEHWNFTQSACTKVYDVHPDNEGAISVILELETTSALLRGSGEDNSFKLLATASQNSSQFKIWKLQMESTELIPYLKIETSFKEGIKFLIETHDT